MRQFWLGLRAVSLNVKVMNQRCGIGRPQKRLIHRNQYAQFVWLKALISRTQYQMK